MSSLPIERLLVPPSNDPSPRSSRRRRNYRRIWESPPPDDPLLQSVCQPNVSRVSQTHIERSENESLSTVLRAVLGLAPVSSPNPLPKNVNDQKNSSPMLETNVANTQVTSLSPMRVPQGSPSAPHSSPSSSIDFQPFLLTEDLRSSSPTMVLPYYQPDQPSDVTPPTNDNLLYATEIHYSGDNIDMEDNVDSGTFTKQATPKASSQTFASCSNIWNRACQDEGIHETKSDPAHRAIENHNLNPGETQLQGDKPSCNHTSTFPAKAIYGTDHFNCSRCGYTDHSPEAVVTHYGYSHPDLPRAFPDRGRDLDISNSNYSMSVLVNCKTPIPEHSTVKSKPPSVPNRGNCVMKRNASSSRKQTGRTTQLPVSECDGVTRYVCSVCDLTLNRPSDLFRHFRSTRHRVACGETAMKHECPHCQTAFSRADAVKRHMSRSCRQRPVDAG